MLSLNNASIYQIGSEITAIDENLPGNPVDPALITEIQRIRITDNMQQDDTDRFIVNYLTIPIEQGTAPNYPPYRQIVDLSISYDSGVTWSATVRKELNLQAIRKNILNWNKLGSCNCITLKFRFWGFNRFVAYNGIMEVKT
jgi:hypothetical protein